MGDTAKKLSANSGAMVTPRIARRLRSQCWLALSDRPSSRYMGTIASKLDGRVNLIKTTAAHHRPLAFLGIVCNLFARRYPWRKN